MVEFLGGTNFVEGGARGREGAWARVETPAGTLLCQGRDTIGSGDRVTVYIRSDAIQPAPPGDDGGSPNRFRARVESLIFVGEYYDAEVTVGNARLMARFSTGLSVGEGQEMDVVIDPSGCRILE